MRAMDGEDKYNHKPYFNIWSILLITWNFFSNKKDQDKNKSMLLTIKFLGLKKSDDYSPTTTSCGNDVNYLI